MDSEMGVEEIPSSGAAAVEGEDQEATEEEGATQHQEAPPTEKAAASASVLPFFAPRSRKNKRKIAESAPEVEGGQDAEPVVERGRDDLSQDDRPRIKKASSSWMFYLSAKRAEIKESHPGASVGQVVKVCSAMWSALSAEEKAVYEKMAEDDKNRMNSELQAAGLTRLPSSRPRAAEQQDLPPDQTTTIVLPLSRVRKTVKINNDVKNINRDGLAMVAKATELFVAHMAKRSWAIAAQSGRKGVRREDTARLVNPRGNLWWLMAEFNREQPRRDKSSSKGQRRAPEPPTEGRKTKSIASFFKKKDKVPKSSKSVADAVDNETEVPATDGDKSEE